jgi:hypothetical protein
VTTPSLLVSAFMMNFSREFWYSRVTKPVALVSRETVVSAAAPASWPP